MTNTKKRMDRPTKVLLFALALFGERERYCRPNKWVEDADKFGLDNLWTKIRGRARCYYLYYSIL